MFQSTYGNDILFTTNDSGTAATFINPRNATNNMTVRSQNNTTTSQSNTDSRGFFGVSRNASNFYNYYKNNTKYTSTDASIGTQNANYLGLYAPTLSATFSQRNLSYLCFGLPLSDEEYFNYYRIIQQYQTLLGRQV